MSLGAKYVFATVMSLVLPMCILISSSCSSVLCMLMALGIFMFVKVMFDQFDEPPLSVRMVV